MKNINELAARIHVQNHKWWHDEHGNSLQRNAGELLMLVITELAEAVEGIRKDLMDDKLPHRKMEEVEMADAKIRLLDFANGFNQTLEELPAVVPTRSGNKAEQILWICGCVVDVYHALTFNGGEVGLKLSFALRGIESYCAHHNLDLDGATEEKLEYNKTREDHTHEARKLANGKKF